MKATTSAIGNFLTTLVIYPITISVGILTARTLGPDGKGLYTFSILIINTLIPILFLGIGAGFQYQIGSKKYKVKYTIFTIFLLAIAGGLIISGLVYLLWKHKLLGEAGEELNKEYLLPILTAIPINSFILFSNLTMKGDSKFKLLNIIQIIKALGDAILLLIFVVVLKRGVLGAIQALVLETLITFLVLVLVYYKIYRPTIQVNWSFIKNSFLYGIKSWMGNLAQQSNDKLDHILLGYFASSSLLGIYSVAFNLLRLMNFIPNAIAPVFFNLIATSNNKKTELQLTDQIHRSILIIVGLCSLFMLLLTPYIIPFLFGPEFSGSIKIVYILIPGMIAYSITRRIISKYLSGKGFPGLTSIVQGVGAVIGALLYFILVPKYNVIGAALGSSIAYICSTSLAIYYYKRYAYPITTNLFYLRLNDIFWLFNKIKPAIKKFM